MLIVDVKEFIGNDTKCAQTLMALRDPRIGPK
jgi:hypothetical protein